MLENITTPIKNTLIVKDEIVEETTSTGIILINGKNKREKTARAVIINIADNLKDRYSVGDIVVYPKYRKREDDGVIFSLKHSDVLGIFKGLI